MRDAATVLSIIRERGQRGLPIPRILADNAGKPIGLMVPL